MRWYLAALTTYADFTGRARRREFWMFTLVNVIVAAGVGLLQHALGLDAVPLLDVGTGPLTALYELALLVPTLAVGARRLHDVGHSGWFQLFVLIPVLGAVVLIVLWAGDGELRPNRWGANPKLPLAA